MSFTEMMESGRGPGVVGMLMALLVLVGFGVLFLFAFDDKLQGGDQSIESFLANQAREIADIENSIANGETRLKEASGRRARGNELATLKRENQIRHAMLDSLRTGIKTSNQSLASLILEFETYKDKYRAVARGKAKGETMSRLQTRNGAVYENVTFRDVTPIGIQIMHDGGHKRIAFEELSTALQERFQFDPKQKAEAVAREEAQRREHEAAVSQATAAESEDLAEKKKIEAEDRRDLMIRSIAIKQSRINSLGDEIKSLENALPDESLKRISRAPQMRAQLSNKQRELSALQADVARMQADLSR